MKTFYDKVEEYHTRLGITGPVEVLHEVLLVFRGELYRKESWYFLDEILSNFSHLFPSSFTVQEFAVLLQEKSCYLMEDEDLLQEAALLIFKYKFTCPSFQFTLWRLGRLLRDFLAKNRFFHRLASDSLELTTEPLVAASVEELPITVSDGFRFLLFDKGNIEMTDNLFHRYWLYTHCILGLGTSIIDKLIMTDNRNVKRWSARMQIEVGKALLFEKQGVGNAS